MIRRLIECNAGGCAGTWPIIGRSRDRRVGNQSRIFSHFLLRKQPERDQPFHVGRSILNAVIQRIFFI